jgi:hypothetical protein
LAGLEGRLVAFHGHQRLVVSVSLLQRSVAVEIERGWIIPLRPRGHESAVSTPSLQSLVPSTGSQSLKQGRNTFPGNRLLGGLRARGC